MSNFELKIGFISILVQLNTPNKFCPTHFHTYFFTTNMILCKIMLCSFSCFTYFLKKIVYFVSHVVLSQTKFKPNTSFMREQVPTSNIFNEKEQYIFFKFNICTRSKQLNFMPKTKRLNIGNNFCIGLCWLKGV